MIMVRGGLLNIRPQKRKKVNNNCIWEQQEEKVGQKN